jgi:hypothetical protein
MRPDRQFQSPDVVRGLRDEHADGSALRGEVPSSFNSGPLSPPAASPTSGNGPRSPMAYGHGYSGSSAISGRYGPAAGHSGHYGMPVNSSSLHSPTALQAASREGIMESRITQPRGASGAFRSSDGSMQRTTGARSPHSEVLQMYSTSGSLGGVV